MRKPVLLLHAHILNMTLAFFQREDNQTNALYIATQAWVQTCNDEDRLVFRVMYSRLEAIIDLCDCIQTNRLQICTYLLNCSGKMKVLISQD